MRLHHARAQPPPPAARAGVSSPSYASRDAAKAEAFCRAVRRRRELRRTTAPRSTIRRSTRSSSPCRRVSPRSHAAGARGRQARAGREAGVSPDGGLPRGGRGARPGRARRAGRRERSLQAAGRDAAPAARRRRDRRDGVRALHDHRAAAEDRRTTGATTRRWPAATRSSRKAFTGCTWPAASARAIVRRSTAIRPSPSRDGPDRARQEHDGGVPLRQRRGRLALLLARDSVAASRACGCRSSSAARASSPSSRTALFVLVRGDGLAAAVVPGLPRHPRLPGDVSRLRSRRSASGARRR